MTLLRTIMPCEINFDQPVNLPEGTRAIVMLGEEEQNFGPLPAATQNHAQSWQAFKTLSPKPLPGFAVEVWTMCSKP